ncbi:DUF4097 family beta strand repeat-containing protein [Streptococcus pyogenes]|uniref:DUF4097 family beta strand repeat-containing protein n=1 Tax=Streptococcus pyogenes TaxID=1314 RepID=UPI0010A11D7B|nr:DUF4097 family beta strand repeat-containing protein [Streptococcus pyogenes]QHB63848.1 DUF4097 family beta strand repeat protein [Streptococcus pyogenes]QIK43019.1 DUF4097 domain-containing protein [Streptococcus pyogenes]QIK45122.1 DUF4097 domain-containing protein [Streptococcus pyogenes]WCE84095.1 DUF4097 family beta strand repeat-containing protein [Streptococcus pyogenes]WER80026.1 DUF4097 family beta strand repeat-containing protein [Streptococcus pyogenes]
MKNISRKCFMTSVVCIVLGAILLGAGYATGGLQDIKHQTAPKKVIKTFDQITALDIDSSASTITVETGPVQRPTVTYYTHPKFIDPIVTTVTGKTLSLSQKPKDVVITGGIEILGFTLNNSRQEKNYRSITITVPEKTSLNEVKGSNVPHTTLSNLTVQDMQFDGNLTLLHTKVKKATITGMLEATKSQLTNLELKADYSLSSLTNSSLENGTISLGHGQLTTKNTNLKSVTIQSLSPGGVEAEETSLENVTFTVTSEQENEETNDNGAIFTAHALTLKGTNTITGGDIDVDITLTKAKAIAYRARTENGKVSLGSQLTPAKIGKESTSDVISYVAENKAATGNLTVNLNKGDITIK